jgi:hypothetical protein
LNRAKNIKKTHSVDVEEENPKSMTALKKWEKKKIMKSCCVHSHKNGTTNKLTACLGDFNIHLL